MHALDLYLPDQRTAPVPVVVWVHGGGWRMGDKADVGFGDISVGRLRDDLLAKGIAVASVNYHLLPQGTKFPEPMQDVSAGVRYLKAHAAELGLDPQRFALAGESAGAHLAAMVAYTPKDDPLHGTLGAKADPSVRAFLGYYGIYELTTRDSQQIAHGCKQERQGADSSHGRLIGANPDAPEGRGPALKASPVSYVAAGSVPALMFHGKQDCTAPYEQSQALADKLRGAGVSQQVVLVDDAGHADDRFYVDDDLRRQAVDFLTTRLTA
ncbi:MAG: alpha/beta hydrolase [Austwickia sp.]|nr:MAG: alpha/beta hydrolase [Austwickia sp.]